MSQAKSLRARGALFGVLMALGLLTQGSRAAVAGADEPLVFVTIADLHVTNTQGMADFKQAIDQINNIIKPAFVYIAGDTPDGATAEQYRLYKAVRDTIRCPVYDVAGDHEARAGGMEIARGSRS